ncbi:hypothetical protein [Ancylobacter mangrovi]|uniref:hypothetical protein n=1 Tax=Ancylobacter mangrovi TaxID=2972472 RepID=UPI002162FC8E|nr:hypothetical protein [Ancylobacter mangrovi]MCS0503856.1 hypothetical protein [Ancylobacter mangrovi]
MKIANLTMSGVAATLGLCALSATPGLAQDVYVRTTEPAGPVLAVPAEPGPTVIVREEPSYDAPDYVVTPPPRVVVREAPAYEAPAYEAPAYGPPAYEPRQVIVAEPAEGPYAGNGWYREVPPYPAPLPRAVNRRAPASDCRMVERETRSGLIRVSTLCD